MTYRVLFTPEAEDHLDRLYRYIAEAADLGIFHGGRDYEAILSEPDDDAPGQQPE